MALNDFPTTVNLHIKYKKYQQYWTNQIVAKKSKFSLEILSYRFYKLLKKLLIVKQPNKK
jgi:hypothetical protein